MKRIAVLVILLVSTFTFAQNTGTINGTILDTESYNKPLAYAKVLIKETGDETLSDENGVFKFEKLKENTYTLVYSFVGYETKESEAKVISNKSTRVKLHLSANTLSLDDLMLTLASSD